MIAIRLLLSGWIITAIIAHMMYKYIQRLQAKVDSLTVVQPRFAHQSNTALAVPNPFQGQPTNINHLSWSTLTNMDCSIPVLL